MESQVKPSLWVLSVFLILGIGWSEVRAAEVTQTVPDDTDLWAQVMDTEVADLDLDSQIAPYDEVDASIQAPQPIAPDPALWMAQSEGEDEVIEEDVEDSSALEITVTGDWVSKYMFRGFDLLDDGGAWQPSVDIGLWDSGVHVNFWMSYASHNRGHDIYVGEDFSRRDSDEHDYTVYWEGSIRDAIDVELGFMYYDYIHLNSNSDFFEWYGIFTLSELPLSPYFGAYYGHEKHDDTLGEGWNTTLGVSHSLPLCGLTVCGSDPLELDLAADIWYNGGQYYVDTGWSHATFGGSVSIPISEHFSFTPGVYYQLSMEDTINDEDEWWTTLSLEYSW